MMKLILSLTLLWPIFSTVAAGGLWCESCTDDLICEDPVWRKCPKHSMCLTASILIISSGIKVHRIYKDCAPPRVCPKTGPQIISVNLGEEQAIASVNCCDTDECNSAILPYADFMQENGLKCPGCDRSHGLCTSVVHCRGLENTCFEAVVEDGPQTLFGCGSANVCNVTGSLDYLPFLEYVGEVLDRPQCWPATDDIQPRCDNQCPCDDCCSETCCSNNCDCNEDNSNHHNHTNG